MSQKSPTSRILEQQRVGLEAVIGKFFPISFTIKGKKLIISEETDSMIEKAKEAVNLSNELNRPIPNSTRDIARYSLSFLEEIFPNLDDYSIVQQKRVLAKRKGSFSVTYAAWDQRKIENTLKKSPKPTCKSEKDNKVLKKIQKEILTAYEQNDQEKMLQFSELLSKFFVSPTNESARVATQINEKINEILRYEEQYHREIAELNQKKAKLENIVHEFVNIEVESLTVDRNFKLLEIGKKYMQTLQEIEELNQDEEVRQFLRILDNAGRRYFTYVSKQGTALPMQLQALELFLNDPINPRFSSDVFSEYIDLFSQSSDELFSGKKWYSRQFGTPEALHQYFLEGTSSTKFFSLQDKIKIKAEIEEKSEYRTYRSHKDALSNKNEEYKKTERKLQTQLKDLESTNQETQRMLSLNKESLRKLLQ